MAEREIEGARTRGTLSGAQTISVTERLGRDERHAFALIDVTEHRGDHAAWVMHELRWSSPSGAQTIRRVQGRSPAAASSARIASYEQRLGRTLDWATNFLNHLPGPGDVTLTVWSGNGEPFGLGDAARPQVRLFLSDAPIVAGRTQ